MTTSALRTALAALAAAVVVVSALVGLGGAALVTTSGTSMLPRFHTGDLAVLWPTHDYRVGDVVGYRSDMLKSVVLHRLVAVESGRYTFRGDHNSFLDPEHPTRDHLVGKLAVRVGHGGIWLHHATSPAALAAVTFALVLSGGAAVHGTRRRRRTMSRHAGPARPRPTAPTALTALPRPVRTTAGVAAALTVAGAALGVLSWPTPAATAAPVPAAPAAPGAMTFSYTASVPRTAAYDGTSVHSPDPVFRTLATTLDVALAYRGSPGALAVDAQLSTPNGWHSTVPLTPHVAYAGDHYDTHVPLDLVALEARATSAASVTRMTVEALTVSVVAHVTTAAGSFEPRMDLALTPLQLKLACDPKMLTVVSAPAPAPAPVVTAAGTLDLLGRPVPLGATRATAVVLLLAGLLGAGAVPVLLRRLAAGTPGARIRRDHAALLCEVLPITPPPGRSVVDVTEFAALARMAERYGLLVLHWATAGVDTFVVHEDDTTYRFRVAGASARHAAQT